MSQAHSPRRYQVFRAHLQEDEELPIEPSPWWSGSDVCIPLEHWEALQQVADERHFVDWKLWEDMSFLDEVYCEEDELQMFIGGLRQLQRALRADMSFMLQRTRTFPEPLPGWEHARMLDAVLATMEISGTQVESYVDGGEPSGEESEENSEGEEAETQDDVDDESDDEQGQE